MPKELLPITDSIGGIFDSPVIQLGLRAIAVYWVVFWFAAAYWAFRDLQLRTENPVLPYFAATFVIVFTPIAFPAAVVIYRIVRPHERIDEVYERTLAEEALLAEIETVRNCPNCRRRVHDEWIVCPTCRTRLNRVCPNCSKLVGLDWSLCAWCGREFERREAAVSPVAVPGSAVPGSAGAMIAGAAPRGTPAGAPAGAPTGTSMAPPVAAPTQMAAPGPVERGQPAPRRSVTPRSIANRTSDRPSRGSLPER